MISARVRATVVPTASEPNRLFAVLSRCVPMPAGEQSRLDPAANLPPPGLAGFLVAPYVVPPQWSVDREPTEPAVAIPLRAAGGLPPGESPSVCVLYHGPQVANERYLHRPISPAQ